MNNQKVLIWALTKIKGVGPAKVFELFCEYDFKIEKVLNSWKPFLINKVDEQYKEHVRNVSLTNLQMLSTKELERSDNLGIKSLCFLDDDFPYSLTQIKPNPCIFLFYKGNPKILKSKSSIAIIGSRMLFDEKNKNKYTDSFSNKVLRETEDVAKYMSDRGIIIVSGLALGCDTSAHKGSLKSLNKKNIAVLAGGLDQIYPRENDELANQIISNGGCLITEQYLEVQPFKYFVIRDRLQTALADSIYIGYSDEQSGTIYACGEAIRQNKSIFLSNNCPLDFGKTLKDLEFWKRKEINLKKWLIKYSSSIERFSDEQQLLKSFNNTDSDRIIKNQKKDSSIKQTSLFDFE